MDEEKEFETGPLSILMQSVKENTQVFIAAFHALIALLYYDVPVFYIYS